jgi:hypothetical protein
MPKDMPSYAHYNEDRGINVKLTPYPSVQTAPDYSNLINAIENYAINSLAKYLLFKNNQ